MTVLSAILAPLNRLLFAAAEAVVAEEEDLPINTSGLEPRGRAVLVKPYEPRKLSDTIEIPETARDRLSMVEQRAVVIAVGESCWYDERCPRAYPGDHVLITKFAGFQAAADMTADGGTYRLINDRDVFCAITGAK